jgi:hypothetical protein
MRRLGTHSRAISKIFMTISFKNHFTIERKLLLITNNRLLSIADVFRDFMNKCPKTSDYFLTITMVDMPDYL